MQRASATLFQTTSSFESFGPSQFLSGDWGEARFSASPAPADVRRCIHDHILLAPGVYGMIDSAGRLIYVGMSRGLKKRLLTYFGEGESRSKERRTGQQATVVVWQPCGHELLAWLREVELIQRFRPPRNVRHHPRRNGRGYIYLNDEPAASFRTAAHVSRKTMAHWGPVPLNRRMQAGVARLNRSFQLRDCEAKTPIRFGDHPTLFQRSVDAGCLRMDIGGCLAPCNGGCTQAQYAASVGRARAFLDGDHPELIERLTLQMEQAAESRQYEQASRYRDQLKELGYVDRQLAILRTCQRNFDFVYPLMLDSASPQWLFVRHGVPSCIVPAPHDATSADWCAETLEKCFGELPPAVDGYAHKLELEARALVISWFQKHPTELQATIAPEDALLMCREWTCPQPRTTVQS